MLPLNLAEAGPEFDYSSVMTVVCGRIGGEGLSGPEYIHHVYLRVRAVSGPVANLVALITLAGPTTTSTSNSVAAAVAIEIIGIQRSSAACSSLCGEENTAATALLLRAVSAPMALLSAREARLAAHDSG